MCISLSRGSIETRWRLPQVRGGTTYIADLFHGEIRVGRDARLAPTARAARVDNDHDWPVAEPTEEIGDLEVGRAEPGARVVEAYWPLLGCIVSCLSCRDMGLYRSQADQGTWKEG